ncbi:MAG TPA: sugar ABC transporter permease [Ktedonobacteraceae bacterium]|nr:sugar ABC transporter permease [Ktedonobacteraceae bacterium]
MAMMQPAVPEAEQALVTKRMVSPQGGRGRRTALTGFAFVLPFLIAYALFLLWPIILGLRMSFFNWSLVGKGTSDFAGLSNYAEALADAAFWTSLWHTILFTILSTPILVVLGLALAILANAVPWGKGIFRLAFFAPYVLPSAVVALIWVWLYEPGFGLISASFAAIGLGNIGWLTSPNVAMLSIVITTVWWTIGFNFILYLAGLQEIPKEMYEAASLDGAGPWARLLHITVPLLGRTTMLVLILQVLASLKIFDQIYLMTTGGPNFSTEPIIEYIYDTGFTTYRVGYASAMSYLFFVIILAISVVLFMLLNRRGGNA